MTSPKKGRPETSGGAAKTAPAAAVPQTTAADTSQPKPTTGTGTGAAAAAAAAAPIAPKLASPPAPAAASPCMVKTDLREFIASKRNAVAGAIGLNPGQQATGERVEYKWPTKTLGSQVHVSHN